MSLEVLQSIEATEQSAEGMRIKAMQEARDIIKAVETACASRERTAAVEMRALYQSLLEQRRLEVQAKLENVHLKSKAQTDELLGQSQSHLDEAATVIFEGVVSNGNR